MLKLSALPAAEEISGDSSEVEFELGLGLLDVAVVLDSIDAASDVELAITGDVLPGVTSRVSHPESTSGVCAVELNCFNLVAGVSAVDDTVLPSTVDMLLYRVVLDEPVIIAKTLAAELASCRESVGELE